MGVKFTGLDELEKDLQRISCNAKKLNGNHKVAFNRLFTKSFMLRHSSFDSFNSFAAASGFDISSQEAFENIPDDEWDKFVAGYSNFKNWNEMLSSAFSEYASKKLFK